MKSLCAVISHSTDGNKMQFSVGEPGTCVLLSPPSRQLCPFLYTLVCIPFGPQISLRKYAGYTDLEMVERNRKPAVTWNVFTTLYFSIWF